MNFGRRKVIPGTAMTLSQIVPLASHQKNNYKSSILILSSLASVRNVAIGLNLARRFIHLGIVRDVIGWMTQFLNYLDVVTQSLPKNF